MWIFWLLLILVVVWVVKASVRGGGDSGSRPDRSPLEILRERYARGEIDQETFERMKRDLDG